MEVEVEVEEAVMAGFPHTSQNEKFTLLHFTGATQHFWTAFSFSFFFKSTLTCARAGSVWERIIAFKHSSTLDFILAQSYLGKKVSLLFGSFYLLFKGANFYIYITLYI